MNRRDILKAIGLGGIGLGIPKIISASNNSNEIASYRDFNLRWSGWIGSPDSTKLVGYWVASNGVANFFSCNGGISGSYEIGQVFNTMIIYPHVFIVLESPIEEKEKEKRLALINLKQEIDYYYNPKPIEKSKFGFGFTGFKN